jgi:hypothetical protein
MGGRLDGWLVLSRGWGLPEGGIYGRHLACRLPWERCFQDAQAEGAGVSTVPDARGQGDAGGEAGALGLGRDFGGAAGRVC